MERNSTEVKGQLIQSIYVNGPIKFAHYDTQIFIDRLTDEIVKTIKGRDHLISRYARKMKILVNLFGTDFDIHNVSKSDLKHWYEEFCTTNKETDYAVSMMKCIMDVLTAGIFELHHPSIQGLKELYLQTEGKPYPFKNTIYVALCSEKTFDCFRFFTYQTSDGKEHLTFYEFGTDNKFLQNLLIDFLKCHPHYCGVKKSIYYRFFADFDKNLFGKPFNNIMDFDIHTFNTMIFIYRSDRDLLGCLKEFCRYIFEMQGENPTITIRDGIIKDAFQLQNFMKLYLDGYRCVLYNPIEDYPSIDRWILYPNGEENKGNLTRAYKPGYFDFSVINDSVLKDALKRWIWESSITFPNKISDFNHIRNFIQFREGWNVRCYRLGVRLGNPEADVKTSSNIMAEEVLAYVIRFQKLNKSTSAAYKSILNRFFSYLKENGLYNVDDVVFDYLTERNVPINQNIPAVPKEEFNKLVQTINEQFNNSDMDKLMYIIFCIQTLTPLRINSILNLKTDCIRETVRTGIYSITAKTKTNSSENRDIQIPKNVVRLIELAEKITEDAREAASDSLKNYLFLIDGRYGTGHQIITLDRYSKWIAEMCKLAGIPRYTSRNLRKTYMTALVEKAVENNVSLMSLKALTDHVKIDTTENYYVRENIRNYLEATKNIVIGDLKIVGKIESDHILFDEKDIVNDNCGYCRNPECNVMGTANCLMCQGFVTTPKHIPFFHEAVSIIDKKMMESSSQHDKEHLYTLKRLYACYLEQLYLEKEKTKDECIK